MTTDEIRQLAEIVSQNGLTLLKYKDGDTEIQLEKAVPAAPVQLYQNPAPAPQFPTAASVDDGSPDFSHLTEVKSPIVGVFYSAPTPESAPFVSIGSTVKKGDILCIIEAMKLMNEITAEVDGEIVDICTNNGDIVEFGQLLFKIF